MSYTNTTRLLGINSGMDTESLVTSMMQAETFKLQRMQKNLISLGWKQEMYRSVHTNLSGFQKTFLDLSSSTSFRLTTLFRAKTTSVKTNTGLDSNAVTVGANAKDGNYSIKIDRLAQADLYESTSKIGGDISSKSKFNVANVREGSSYEISINGTSQKISFKEGDVVGDETITFKDGNISLKDSSGNIRKLDEQGFIDVFNQKLKDTFGMEGTGGKQIIEAKLNTNGGITIATNGFHTGFSIADGDYLPSLAEAGKDGSFTDGKADSDSTLEFTVKYNGEESKISVDVEKGMTKEEVVEALNTQLESKSLSVNLQFGVDEATGNINITGGSLTDSLEIKNSKDGSLEYLGFESTTLTLPETSSLSGIGITSGTAAKFSSDSKLGDIFGGSLTKETSFTINGKEFTFDANTTMSELINEVNSAGLGVKLSYNEYTEVFQLESNDTGFVNKINMSGEFLTNNLGFGTTAKRAATDSIATINGITLTRATNSYDFEGVNWKLNRVTEGEELEVNVSRDVDSIMENITNFVDGYNELIAGLSELTSATRPKTNGSYGTYYEPLIDEEKAAMSETQIAQWEKLAKTGLLNRDSIISGVVQQLRSALYQPVTLEDGSKISLHEIGITTSNDWQEGGKLVIDEEKLRTAISERGDAVMDLFSKGVSQDSDSKTQFAEGGLAYRMNTIINSATSPNGSIADKAGIVGYRSETNNSIYNQMKSENDKINLMYERLADKETYYYNLFSRMEASISKSNSQLEYLLSAMGGS